MDLHLTERDCSALFSADNLRTLFFEHLATKIRIKKKKKMDFTLDINKAHLGGLNPLVQLLV